MKNELFYYTSDTEIYWHAVVVAAAVLIGCSLFAAFSLMIKKTALRSVKWALLFSLPLALTLARVQYCFFRQGEFKPDGGYLDLTRGGFGLYGAMLGVAGAIAIACGLCREMKLTELLDAASVGGCAAVAIGRAACAFSHEELGFALTKDFLQPLMFTVFDEAENAWHVKVYVYESLTAAILFAVLLLLFALVYRREKFVRGTVFACFVFVYSVTQTFLESWRMDSLFLNSLGFVRFSQAFSAVIFAVLLVIFCVRWTKRFGFSSKQIFAWVALTAFTALAFTCEFTLTGNTRLRNYSGMGVGLLGVLVIGCVMLFKTFRTENAGKTHDSAPQSAQ